MNLKTARAMKGKTQWDVRKSTGINQTKLSLIENGYVIPNERERLAISELLGLNVGDIDWPVRKATDLR